MIWQVLLLDKGVLGALRCIGAGVVFRGFRYWEDRSRVLGLSFYHTSGAMALRLRTLAHLAGSRKVSLGAQ